MRSIKGVVKRNEKGFFIREGKFFAIIDKTHSFPFQEGEEWEFFILKKIRDRRGQEVPILRPVKRLYHFDESRGVFICGSHHFLPARISVKEIREKYGDYLIVGEVLSPEGESFSFKVYWGTFQGWESLPEDVKKEVKEEVERREREKEERRKKEWEEMKRDVEVQKYIEKWKKYWVEVVREKEEKIKKEMCEVYNRLEQIYEEIKSCQVVDFRIYFRDVSSHRTKVFYHILLKGAEEYIVVEREEWKGGWVSYRDDEPNRLCGIGIGDWLTDVYPKEVEAWRREYERYAGLCGEREELIEELERGMEWLDKWEDQEEKLRFEDTGEDLEAFMWNPRRGEWGKVDCFRSWYVCNVIFEGE